jgi:carboxymethylenebutenolidase
MSLGLSERTIRRLAEALSVLALAACGSGGTQAEDPVSKAVDAPADEGAKGAPSPHTGMLSEGDFKALHQLSPDKVPPPRGQKVQIEGTAMYLSLPEGKQAPLPALVVIHEWWGLNDNIRHWTDRLAEDGYAALAVDLYGGKVATTPDEAMATMKAVDEKKALATMLAIRRS